MSANSKLGEELISLHHQQFTGILTIKSQNSKQWQLYFYLGKFLWAKGGFHPNRSWRRHLTRYFPEVDKSLLILPDKQDLESPNYYLITSLLQKKIVNREQVKALIESRVKEIFFDLLQQEYKGSLQFSVKSCSAHYLLKAGFSLSLAFLNLEQLLFQSQQAWSTWGGKGLASCSPNHAPLLKNDRELQQQISNFIFTSMSQLLNGKNTLRDLAIRMDKDVLEVTCGIVPYFFKGYLRLLEVPDIPDFTDSNSKLSSSNAGERYK